MKKSILGEDFKRELVHFETFLHRIGFKRLEGAIYGLLVLSEQPLTSEEIEEELGLSQSAVSQGLKRLGHFGAVETIEAREGRTRQHTAREDSLAIVSSVFRKREEEAIQDFKRMAERIRQRSTKHPTRAARLTSIITTCEMAQSVMNFVIELVNRNHDGRYDQIVKKLPQVLSLLTNASGPLHELTQNVADKVRASLSKIAGDINAR
jgi:DNA-binding transcriptional regulator GbsR (MarR family)